MDSKDPNMLTFLNNIKNFLQKPALSGTLIYQKNHFLSKVLVFENDSYRWLCFDNKAIQSQILKHEPWQPIMNFISPLASPIELYKSNNALILGGGGGALYHFLTHHYPSLNTTFIEYNPEVIKAGIDYFYLPDKYALLSDAKDFMVKCNQLYSHIIVDLFSYKISPLYQDTRFLESLVEQSIVSLSFNILTNSRKMKKIISLLRKTLGENSVVLFIPNSTNVIFHLMKGRPISHFITALEKRRLIEPSHWDSSIGFYSVWK